MTNFKKIAPTELTDNFFQTIANEWFLIAAGNKSDFNTMTASWGTIGIMWHKPIAMSFIRPGRYTYEFIEKNDIFTMSFFDKEHHDKLLFCGSNSGRTVDKIKEVELTPFDLPETGVSYEEARLVLVCKKIYFDDLKPENFMIEEEETQKLYPQKDYHRMYFGEILACYTK